MQHVQSIGLLFRFSRHVSLASFIPLQNSFYVCLTRVIIYVSRIKQSDKEALLRHGKAPLDIFQARRLDADILLIVD